MKKGVLTGFLMAVALAAGAVTHRALVFGLGKQLDRTWGKIHGDNDVHYKAEDADEQKARIVDECISQLSPHCAEILTLFYYKEMSLDEILEQRSDRNASKNGLKTAKRLKKDGWLVAINTCPNRKKSKHLRD